MMKVKKLSFKFFLVQVIVLLSGPLLAHSCQDLIRSSSARHHMSFEHTNLLTEELFTRSASLGTEKQNCRLSITLFENEEDDEFNSYKKHLESGHHPASVFFAQAQGLFLSDSETILTFYRYFSSVSSGRYLLLQVFRI